MRILLVEDDAAKAERICQFIRSKLTGCDVTIAKSFKSGLAALVVQPYGFVVLDMTLPTFDISLGEDGGIPLAFGGKEILRQMQRRGIFAPVIVATQFERFGTGEDATTREELAAELAQDYPAIFRGMVYYHPTQDRWKLELDTALNHLGLDGADA